MSDTLHLLRERGQSLWLDQVSRELLTDGALAYYIRVLGVSGLTSNPTLFEHALGHGCAYDDDIVRLARHGDTVEALFFRLALQDLRAAADELQPSFEESGGLDGWASLAVSPLLAHNAARTIQAAAALHDAANRDNLFIQIPGTAVGMEAVEESIFAGIPVNVTLLFSSEHYLAASRAYARGIERRLIAGLSPRVACVTSLFVSRWDPVVKRRLPLGPQQRLGLAMAKRTYRAHVELLASPRWQALASAGARPQRLLWASSGGNDSAAADTFYIQSLMAPGTISAIPEATLLALAEHGELGPPLPGDGGDAEIVIAEFKRAGLDDGVVAARLQRDETDAYADSWHALMLHMAPRLVPRLFSRTTLNK
ncbi:transaldolase [Roseateles sp.]|uniref:transaldolase n=1 Tax=Roseateles sp. TaxID=1971397 RepID=UPI0032633C85